MSPIAKKFSLWEKDLIALQSKATNWDNVLPEVHEVQVFYAKLELLEARLTNTREEYFATASDEDIAKNEDSLITWENSLYNLQVKCTKFKNRCEQAATSRNKETPFKLEKLSISEFNGKFSEWRDFYGTFTTAVADNTYLKESEKLVYLRKALIGEAKSIVSNFDTNETSFASAWALVKKRYSNPREIIFAHIRTFDEMKHVQESSAGIRKLVDGINELTRSLTSLGVPVNHWDLIIIYYALKKLDSTSKREWLLSLSSNDPPKLEPFVNFLERRASAFADSNFHIKSNQPSKPQPPNQSSFKSKSYTSAHAESSTSSCKSKSCLACEGDHYLFQCKTFSSYPVSDRNKFVRDHHLCLNCMFRGHTYLSCPTNFACKLCQKKHHTLLHEERKQKPNSSQSSNMPVYLPVSSSNSHKSSAHISSESEVNVISNQCIPTQSFNHIVAILETALVYVKDFKARLGLARKKTCANVGGIGGIQAVIINGISSVDITSRVQDYSINLNVLIIPKLTGSNLPRTSIKSDHAYLNKLCLADPGYATPSQVDILIGTRSLGKLKLPGLIIGPPGCPDAQNSVFGWIISGESCSTSSSHLSFELSTHHTNCTPFEPCLDLRIKKFWEIEEVEQSLSLTSEDKLCEEIFKCTTIKEPSGRYAVTLPFKPDAPQLGNSRIQAIKRFYNLEKNLSKNLDIYESYTDQMQSNLDNNIMEEVPTLEIDNPLSYYMPHHIVTKLKSSSTRHRIVFDASAKTSNGLSLNNVLMTGPKIQTDLIPLLIHFRTHLVAFSADIVKFYNQFVVSHPHSDFQRFIWRKSPEDTLKDYRMNRVTFGVTTAPYLAIRCLHELADEHRETHPLVYHILKEQFLVDNLLSGAQNIDEAKEIQTQLIEVLSKPLLKLRKWSSNYPQVIQSIPAEDREMIFPCNVATDNSIKTIGLLWSPISDTISIKLPEYSNQSTTKRELLSSIAKVFDPLGFLSPVTVRPKVILQQLWKEKLDWDTKIPNYIQEQWDTYIQDLGILCKFTINRCLTKSSSSCNSEHPPIYEIYGFSDASNTAYSAVVYLKTTGIPGSSSSELIMAKTKVAPLKNESIPRLELCGAALLVKIIPGIIEAMKIPILSIRCFSDSSCVLGWISSAKKQEVFVQNRINKINHDLPGAVWGYVSTKENPADVASRGISAKKLLCDPLWLHGPPWILTNEIMVNISTEIDSSFSTFNEKILEIINKTSSFNSMKRKVAYFIRFINNLNRSSPKNYGPFTVAEFRQSIIILVKAVQEEVYHKEINLCKKNKTHLTTIKSMTPFLDHQSVLRVGGRLRNSFLTYDQQHPILLPKKTSFHNSHRSSFSSHQPTSWTSTSPSSHPRQILDSTRDRILFKNCQKLCQVSPI